MFAAIRNATLALLVTDAVDRNGQYGCLIGFLSFKELAGSKLHQANLHYVHNKMN